ncbi:sulfatase-like hydrolase/transferase [Myxococcota bacterium]|nr:sulfatase-like hydrolase/transferase [Myxococcota bacterium]
MPLKDAEMGRCSIYCLALCFVLGMSGCDDGPPNLVLISIDTIRADRTSLHGHRRDTTPRLAALARQGARFEAAYSATASTGPSHASLFTGRYPLEHGLVKNGLSLDDRWLTLAERLEADGYRTAGIAGSYVLDPQFGFGQGFAHYDAEFRDASIRPNFPWEGHVVPTFDRRAYETTDRAIAWLRKQRNEPRPFFLFLHYFDPHSPYEAPGDRAEHFDHEVQEPADLRRARYDAELAYTDSQIGRLLDALPAYGGLHQNTLIVVTGDHGEGLGDHGFGLHAVHLYEEAVRVPLVMRLEGAIPAGRVVDEPVESIDIVPTVLDLLGLAKDDDRFPGRSLRGSLVHDEALDSLHPVFLVRRHYPRTRAADVAVDGFQYGLRSGRWKLIVEEGVGRKELFDLELDPAELKNRYEDEPAVAARLTQELSRWRDESGGAEAVPEIDFKTRQGLEALGYGE